MTELFESTIENVSDIDIKCYSDPDPEHTVMEIFAERSEEAYVYKFTGHGVRINGLYKLMTNNEKLRSENQNLKEENKNLKRDNEKLREENKQLKKENEKLRDRFSNQIPEYIEKNNRLQRKKEEREVSAVAAKEKNKLLEIENEKLKKELHSLKLEKTNIPKTPSSRSDILDQAKKCVCGQREQDYGTPESNFQLIADLWNGYLGFMDHPQDQIRATDVAMMMALLKIARIRNGGGSGDSFVDLAGYAACGGEIYYGERYTSD